MSYIVCLVDYLSSIVLGCCCYNLQQSCCKCDVCSTAVDEVSQFQVYISFCLLIRCVFRSIAIQITYTNIY